MMCRLLRYSLYILCFVGFVWILWLGAFLPLTGMISIIDCAKYTSKHVFFWIPMITNIRITDDVIAAPGVCLMRGAMYALGVSIFTASSIGITLYIILFLSVLLGVPFGVGLCIIQSIVQPRNSSNYILKK